MVSVVVQVVEFDLLFSPRYSKSSGIFSQTGAGKVALSELTLIPLKPQGDVCNSITHRSHSGSKTAFGWSGVGGR